MAEEQAQSKNALKKAEKQAKMAAAKAEKAAKTLAVVGGKKADDSKQIIGMTVSKDENFAMWYHDLVIKAELVEYYSEVGKRTAPYFYLFVRF